MIKSIPLFSGSQIEVKEIGGDKVLIDYEVPQGYNCVLTISIDLFPKIYRTNPNIKGVIG